MRLYWTLRPSCFAHSNLKFSMLGIWSKQGIILGKWNVNISNVIFAYEKQEK